MHSTCSESPFKHVLWDIKLKATNKQGKQKFTDTDNRMVATRGKGVGEVKGKRGQIYGDRKRFDFGW